MLHFPDCGEEESKQVNAINETSTRKSRKRKLEDEMNNLEVESESKKSRRRTKRRKAENGVSEDCVLFDEQVMKFFV